MNDKMHLVPKNDERREIPINYGSSKSGLVVIMAIAAVGLLFVLMGATR